MSAQNTATRGACRQAGAFLPLMHAANRARCSLSCTRIIRYGCVLKLDGARRVTSIRAFTTWGAIGSDLKRLQLKRALTNFLKPSNSAVLTGSAILCRGRAYERWTYNVDAKRSKSTFTVGNFGFYSVQGQPGRVKNAKILTKTNRSRDRQ